MHTEKKNINEKIIQKEKDILPIFKDCVLISGSQNEKIYATKISLN